MGDVVESAMRRTASLPPAFALLEPARKGLLPLLLAMAGAPGVARAIPRLEVVPAAVVEGSPVSIRVEGLEPGALATLHLQSVEKDDDGREQPFHGQAAFRADARGRIDLATAAPVSGNYNEADLRGLFWSQRPLAADSAGQAAIRALHLSAPDSVEADQNVLTLECDGGVVDRAILRFMKGDSDVVREAVTTDSLVGVFYRAKSAVRRPVVVVLGGSEGGLDVADWAGPKLASRGFAVFGLDYFSPPGSAVPGVPTAIDGIPLESLERVRAWLRERPEVDIGRLGILGYSKGSEFALVLASTYDWIRAVAAYSPSDVVWQGIRYGGGPAGSSWSIGGRDLAFLPTTGTRDAIQHARASGTQVELADILRASRASAAPRALDDATIPIERSHAALLIMGGDDDRLGDSGASVRRLAARLKAQHYRHPVESLRFPGAGHVILGTGWRPTTTDNDGLMKSGGTPAADARAQREAWARAVSFLGRELAR